MTDSLPDPDPISKPRGLWSLMAKSAAENQAESDCAESDVPLRSLFKVMQQSSPMAGTLPEQTVVPDLERENPPELLNDAPPLTDADSDTHPMFVIDLETDVRSKQLERAARLTRSCRLAMTCGIASIGLSPLVLLFGIWAGIPSSVCGFAALILGYVTLTGDRSSERPPFTRFAPRASMLLGTVGIFSGPLGMAAFNRWGR